MIIIKSQFLLKNFTTDLSVSLPFWDNFPQNYLGDNRKAHQMLFMCPVRLSFGSGTENSADDLLLCTLNQKKNSIPSIS